jgi:hypothetical protein
MGLDNSNIIRLERFLKNLGRLLMDIDLIRARLIEFVTRITDVLGGGKLLD